MKAYHAIIVFLIFAMPAFFIGLERYKNAKNVIIDDMSRALSHTLQQQELCVITPDTITNYKQNLRIEDLREKSFVSFASENKNKQFLTSRKIKWRGQNGVAFQAYADIGMVAILGLSDQRQSSALAFLAFVWACFSIFYIKKNHSMTLFGEIGYDENNDFFYDNKRNRIDFTPMQKDVMIMLWHANGHTLHKNLMCEKLWPKKPDASETLYTLIKRLRKKLDSSTSLHISSDNNGHYKLTEHKE